MIRFKQKLYFLQESHQVLNDGDRFGPDPSLEEIYGKMELRVEPDDTYTEQYQKSFERPRIKKLVKDIREGHYYDDGPAGGETHYLSEFSKAEKYHLMSKKINPKKDRLNYRIYAPKVINGKYVMKIVLINCLGHNITGIGNYSEHDEERGLRLL